jgi:hypothetical protein
MCITIPLSYSRAIGASVRYRLHTLLAVLLASVFLGVGPAHAERLLGSDADFKLLASLGFEQAVDGAHADGTRTNDYAWSMAWFKGKLYVGTGRFEVDPAIEQPPHGQIWAYTPGGAGGASGTWARVYQSPNFFGAPREFGYRWMTQCNFRGTDYLFISTLGTAQGNILFTRDGVNFTPVSRAGFPSPAVGFRTMLCFTDPRGKQMLITTPVGQFGNADTFDPDRTDNPIVLANENPVSGYPWSNYSPLRMGNPDNNTFFSLHAMGGWLYAGVANEVTGGELWRTRGCGVLQGACVPTWTKVIDRGGGRPASSSGVVGNKGFSDMMAHGNDLYLAISSPALDGDLIRAELWRLRPDATFEVLIGEPRLNFGASGAAPPTNPAYPASLRCGLPLEDIDGIGGANDCPPTTRRGAGFGAVGSAATGYARGAQFYFWRLYKYAYNAESAPLGDDRLYMGTLHLGGRTSSGTNPQGFDLYATTDGVDWRTVTNSGIGYPQQQGMRSIAASPYGLFVGGTHFATGLSTEIRGANVWLGAPLPDANAPVTAITSPPSPDEGATLAVRNVTFDWLATDAPPPGSAPLTYAYRLDPVAPAFSAFAAATTKSYAGLANGTYTFHVIAKDAAGNTEAPGAAPGASNRRTFTIDAPDLPPTVVITIGPASPSPTGNVGFTWAGSDDVTPPASLLYDRWLAPPQTDSDTYTPGTTANFSGLADGAYTFHIRAKDGAGNVGPEVTQAFTVAIPPDLPPAVTITSGPASPNSTGSVSFTWAGNDDVTPPASLLYDRWLSPLQADPGTFTPGTTANFVGLADGAYTFHVKAKDGAGNVGVEITQSFTVAIPPGPPATPSPVTATLIGPRLLRFAWTDVATETGYFVERCTEIKRKCAYSAIASNLAPNTTFLDDAVPAGMHTYRVRGCNGAGCSGWATSNSVTVP